jgi:hypothetical protein
MRTSFWAEMLEAAVRVAAEVTLVLQIGMLASIATSLPESLLMPFRAIFEVFPNINIAIWAAAPVAVPIAMGLIHARTGTRRRTAKVFGVCAAAATATIPGGLAAILALGALMGQGWGNGWIERLEFTSLAAGCALVLISVSAYAIVATSIALDHRPRLPWIIAALSAVIGPAIVLR